MLFFYEHTGKKNLKLSFVHEAIRKKYFKCLNAPSTRNFPIYFCRSVVIPHAHIRTHTF